MMDASLETYVGYVRFRRSNFVFKGYNSVPQQLFDERSDIDQQLNILKRATSDSVKLDDGSPQLTTDARVSHSAFNHQIFVRIGILAERWLSIEKDIDNLIEPNFLAEYLELTTLRGLKRMSFDGQCLTFLIERRVKLYNLGEVLVEFAAGDATLDCCRITLMRGYSGLRDLNEFPWFYQNGLFTGDTSDASEMFKAGEIVKAACLVVDKLFPSLDQRDFRRLKSRYGDNPRAFISGA